MTDIIEKTLNPVGNTGGFENEGCENALNSEYVVLLHDGEKSLPVLINRPIDGEMVAHDWFVGSFCNSNFGDEYLSFNEENKEKLMDELAFKANEFLQWIFGFGISTKHVKNFHFYSQYYEIEDGLGLLLLGHPTGRFAFDINATGLAYAKKGWQLRLFKFLEKAKRAQITRVDLAYDDFDGRFSVDWALEQYKGRGFTSGKRRPSVSQFGNWVFPDGKGRTLNVGKRENGKVGRSYEKGMQLGDSSSDWVRHELEIRNTERIIPFDILLHPTSYFRAAFPCYQEFPMDAPPCRIELKQKESKITWNKALSVLSDSYGKYLHQFRQVYGDEVILNLLTHGKTDVPKRLIPCEKLAKRHFESFLQSTADSMTASDNGSQVNIKQDAKL